MCGNFINKNLKTRNGKTDTGKHGVNIEYLLLCKYDIFMPHLKKSPQLLRAFLIIQGCLYNYFSALTFIFTLPLNP